MSHTTAYNTTKRERKNNDKRIDCITCSYCFRTNGKMKNANLMISNIFGKRNRVDFLCVCVASCRSAMIKISEDQEITSCDSISPITYHINIITSTQSSHNTHTHTQANAYSITYCSEDCLGCCVSVDQCIQHQTCHIHKEGNQSKDKHHCTSVEWSMKHRSTLMCTTFIQSIQEEILQSIVLDHTNALHERMSG